MFFCKQQMYYVFKEETINYKKMPDATTDLYYNYILHIQIGTYMFLSKPKIIYLNDGCF